MYRERERKQQICISLSLSLYIYIYIERERYIYILHITCYIYIHIHIYIYDNNDIGMCVTAFLAKLRDFVELAVGPPAGRINEHYNIYETHNLHK